MFPEKSHQLQNLQIIVTSIKQTRIDDIERLTRGHVNVVTELHHTSIFINIIKFFFVFFITIMMIPMLYGNNEGSVQSQILTALLMFILDYPICKTFAKK